MLYPYLLLFFVYSFLGWVLESVLAVIHRRKFVNPGVLAGPLCCRYGVFAVFITVFGGELQQSWFFLLVGCTVIGGLLEWGTGRLLEKLTRQKWWEYSHRKYHLDGYVSLQSALLSGVAGVLLLHFINPLITLAAGLLPAALLHVLLWVAVGLLVIDGTWSLCTVLGVPQKLPKTESVHNRLAAVTLRLSGWIVHRTEERFKRSYPQLRKREQKKARPTVFAQGCSFPKLFWLFLIGAFLGDIVETIFCRMTAGVWMSRSSLVWGPFSIVWGLAIALATLLLYNHRDRSDGTLFVLGTVLGGVYEYVCSVFTEIAFGQVFWDYSAIPFNLGGRINLLYCFFWGIAAVIWLKKLYPVLSGWIERIPQKVGTVLTVVLIVFMVADIGVSALALGRSGMRAGGVPPQNTVEQWLDVHYDDAVMERIYPNSQLAK